MTTFKKFLKASQTVFLGVFVAVGVWAMGAAAAAAARGRASQSWPKVPGTVVAADCAAVPARIGSTFMKRLRYEYAVDGKSYAGEREYFGTPISGYSCVAGYIPPQSVPVYYDPADPRESVLIPGRTKAIGLGFAAGLLFALFGCVGAALVWRGARARAVKA